MSVLIGTGNTGVYVTCELDPSTENGYIVTGLTVSGPAREKMAGKGPAVFLPFPDPMGVASVLATELQKEASNSILDELFG